MHTAICTFHPLVMKHDQITERLKTTERVICFLWKIQGFDISFFSATKNKTDLPNGYAEALTLREMQFNSESHALAVGSEISCTTVKVALSLAASQNKICYLFILHCHHYANKLTQVAFLMHLHFLYSLDSTQLSSFGHSCFGHTAL